MGKRHRGWRLSQPDRRTGIYFARFTYRGRRYNLSTRTTDRAAAQIEAAGIHAEIVSGPHRRNRGSRDLAETMGEWLAEHEGVWSERHYDARLSRSRTIANYFETTAAITEDSIRQFYLARLRKVTNGAVKLDRSALKMFCEWAAEAGYMPAISIPPLPKGIKGTSAIDRPHVRLTPEQARTIIEELPEHTKISRKPIRTMMEVAWDTGLRAYGLWRLESPRHCPRRGELYMSSDIDKEGFARTLRLRPETSDRLDALGDGLLFGKFTYLRTLRKAAHRVANVTGLTAYECDHVDLRDFRHAAATALWHQSNSLAAVAFMLGHTQETTTVRYLDLHENVYAEAIDKHFSVAKLVAVGDDVSRPVPNVLQSLPTPTGAPAPAPARM